MFSSLLVVLLAVLGPMLLLTGVAIGTEDEIGNALAVTGMLAIAAALVLMGLKVLRRSLRRR